MQVQKTDSITICRADPGDLPAVARLYAKIHEAEEAGLASTGWLRDVYPTAETAGAALRDGELFVLAENGEICGAAIINQRQLAQYRDADWRHDAADDQVMVLHTLVIDPDRSGRGYGRRFVDFYAGFARAGGCRVLRMDTNARNSRARRFYQKIGFREAGTVATDFNGIPGVELVLLERPL